MERHRTEKDTLGEVKVPADAYYGAQTQRALHNFPISGLTLQPAFIIAQAIVKRAAAKANAAAGKLDREIADAIEKAAGEVMAGALLDQFKVDVYQAGAGTSQNMNMNEVLANRAEELLGGKRGKYKRVHPNDHVNMAQSTNDTIHTAIHVSAVVESNQRLVPAVTGLEKALRKRAKQFDRLVKTGRTHLQDAVPIRLGQEFGGWAAMLAQSRTRVVSAVDGLRELCIGGSAVGTGLNTPRGYRARAVRHVSQWVGERFRPADNLFEAMQSLDAIVALSGALSVLATSAKKIADDVRLLSSGPRTGLGEVQLPVVQPGSSIMPGKVNPVMAEMLNMVCFGVFGNDATIRQSAQAGQLQLNVMMPLVAYKILDSIAILSAALDAFTDRCINGITANKGTLLHHAERSSAVATALSPYLGYYKAAELAKEALENNVTVRELAEDKGLLTKEELDEILDLRRMTENPNDRKK